MRFAKPWFDGAFAFGSKDALLAGCIALSRPVKTRAKFSGACARMKAYKTKEGCTKTKV